MGCGGSTGSRALNETTKSKLEELFDKMDSDSSGSITKEEAMKFFKSFSKVNCKAFFDEVDDDQNGTISKVEFMRFWAQVRGAGYSNDQILEELDELIEGTGWVNWKDGKDVGLDSKSGPQSEYKAVKVEETPAPEAEERVPDATAEASPELTAKLEEMFSKMDVDADEKVTKEEAQKFFTNFKKVNCKAFFDEVDDDQNGRISKEEFMGFWTQVRRSGYSNEEILEELQELADGGAWVNWKDGKDVTEA